ncbi:LysM peptidoglycan-binding domain-containing protein [Salsipaludibacter albus]|uniref:LysM peptidoglycan-binding domain-containing protein n=1 Tax=Salsipaludibacter albus TaxID=2849650 RepID=UPI001EE4E45D|nr:M23 family metallopeptidase [Salsipaludibacter albus]
MLGGLVLCGVAAVVVGLSSADWKVEAGDTLYSIANATGSSVDAIAAANDIDDPNLIYVGQVFVTPEVGADAPGDAAPDEEPPAAEPDAVDPPPSSSDAVTTSQAGDTLASIADRLGITVDQLEAANGYTHGPLSVGRRVRASSPPPPSAGGGGAATHVVGTGEMLAGIADRYGVSWQDLAAANDLPDPNVITTGTALAIPGRGGGMTCPVNGAVSFINDFGVAKPGGRHHEGIDLHADRGTPVVAPVSGRVEHVTGTRGGKQFHLFGDDGYRYWGTHLDELGASGRVEAGEVLGTVGTSGNAAGGPPHLHFEVYRDGISINSWPTLAQVC